MYSVHILGSMLALCLKLDYSLSGIGATPHQLKCVWPYVNPIRPIAQYEPREYSYAYGIYMEVLILGVWGGGAGWPSSLPGDELNVWGGAGSLPGDELNVWVGLARCLGIN